jgi:hypothetical protein
MNPHRGGFGGHGFRGEHFERAGFGYGGYYHRGFGFGGFGGGPWLSPGDFWLFGDLFGLALDFGRFAAWPTWGLLGANLLDTGLQALSSGDDSYGSNANDQYYANGPQPYAPLCGNYYSDENPGCLQQF